MLGRLNKLYILSQKLMTSFSKYNIKITLYLKNQKAYKDFIVKIKKLNKSDDVISIKLEAIHNFSIYTVNGQKYSTTPISLPPIGHLF